MTANMLRLDASIVDRLSFLYIGRRSLGAACGAKEPAK